MRDTKILNDKRLKFLQTIFINPIPDGIKKEIGQDVDYIVHMAAETHVDNSIKDPKTFLDNNIEAHLIC